MLFLIVCSLMTFSFAFFKPCDHALKVVIDGEIFVGASQVGVIKQIAW